MNIHRSRTRTPAEESPDPREARTVTAAGLSLTKPRDTEPGVTEPGGTRPGGTETGAPEPGRADSAVVPAAPAYDPAPPAYDPAAPAYDPAPPAYDPAPASPAARAAQAAEEIDRLGRRMERAIGGFVDDPRRAVKEADAVLEDAATRLARLLEERRKSLRRTWHADDDTSPGTEELRVALTHYRDMTRQLLTVA